MEKERRVESCEGYAARPTDRPCIAIETSGRDPRTYWFPSVQDLALAYNVSSMKVLRSIEDGRPIDRYGVYVDYEA